MENYEEKNEITVEEDFADDSSGNDWKKEVWEWAKAIIFAVIIALVLRTYVLTLAKVDGASMEPSLQHADRLYVNKLFYTPERGDVVIVKTEDPRAPFYIKRVIAAEGDSLYIDFDAGEVFVNGEKIDEPYIAQPTHLRGYYIYNLMKNEGFSADNPLVLGEDEYFVMGDNRNNSKDSREIGPISGEDVVGHALFRFWPLDKIGNTDYTFEN